MDETQEEGKQSGNVEQCYCYADREVCGEEEVSEDKELHNFVEWLLDYKERRDEDMEDNDYYAIGIYAIWLYEKEKKK